MSLMKNKLRWSKFIRATNISHFFIQMKGHGVFFKLSLQFRVTKHRCIREQSLVLRLQLLRRYDTIKTCRWNFFKFSWVVHYRKIWGSPCYFLSSRGQKIKNITKIEQMRLFLFTFLVSFFMAFPVQNLICVWLAKRWPKCAPISIQKLM